MAQVNSSYTADSNGFSSVNGSAPVTITAYTIGQETTLDSIKDYDGSLHAGDNLAATASSYKYQGMLDVNGDGSLQLSSLINHLKDGLQQRLIPQLVKLILMIMVLEVEPELLEFTQIH